MSQSPLHSVRTPVGSKSSLSRIQRAHSDEMVRCPTCLKRVSLKDYIHEHSLKIHGWSLNRVCIYCSAGESWPSGKRNFKHIVPCLLRFLEGKVPCAIEKPLSKALQPCEKCQNFRSIPRDMCKRVKKGFKYKKLYESWYERPEEYGESAITFTEESGLGRDIYGIVQRYLRGDLEWYHLMVHHQNFDNFVKAFKRMRHRMFLLPFWCLCDGLTRKRKTHRHMIMAFEPGAPFKEIWKKEVKYDLNDGGRSKKCIRIESAFHFIRTIQYVSQRKASCDGKWINDAVKEDAFKNSHFCINRSFHEHAIVCMSMMFRGGLQCLVNEQTKNKDIVGWLKHIRKIPDVHRHLKYAVPIGETGLKFLNCVLPLSREFVSSEEETPLCLHWIGDKKLYLRTDPHLKNLSREEWYPYQAVKGNTVSSISEEWYVLFPRQQNVMKQIKIALDEKEEMDQKIREEMCRVYDARITALEAESADMRQTMTIENADLKEKIADVRQTIQTVQGMMSKLSWEQKETDLNWVLTNVSYRKMMKQCVDQMNQCLNKIKA